MTKNSSQGPISREALQRWLNTGSAPLTAEDRSGSLVTVLKLPKTPEIDYLYGTSARWAEGISWGSDLQFCGAYDRRGHALYLADRPLVNIAEGITAAERESDGLTRQIINRVNQRVEERIANDRRNLSISKITDSQTLRELTYYQSYYAKEDAIQRFINSQAPDGQFHSSYNLDGLTEAAFIDWLQDPEGFISAEAESYMGSHQEVFLSDFLRNDALLTEYQALAQDTGSPIHRMKAITEAIRLCGGKMVTVTVRKDGTELTFKASASSLNGYKNSYSPYDIPAADRREFERVFGRHASYTAEDITAIASARRTIYEAPPVQTEEQDVSLKIGGI